MKQFFQSTYFLLLALLLPATALAHDFEVGGIYYLINDNEAWVTYRGSYCDEFSNEYSGSVTIPSTVTYNGTTYPVTQIADEAFRNCTGLTSVSIPNTVTIIGFDAFRDCTSLTSISIPTSITAIRNSAFDGCTGLTNLTIPNSVTYIGYYAFYGSGLTSVTIPTSVTFVGPRAFKNCPSLKTLKFNAISCDDFTTVDDDDFLPFDSYITNVTIGSNVQHIPAGFLRGCSQITSITIPKSVTSIGNYAFAGCSGLTSITVSSTNPNYDSRNNCKAIIETASNTLIAGCKNTVIPNTVTAIGGYAFYGSGLTNITIPNSVTSIGTNPFAGCNSLTDITVANDNPNYDSRDNCNAIIETASNKLISGCMSTVIPNSVTTIGAYAFYRVSSLTSVNIHNSITSINNYAFNGCSGLTSISIPNSITLLGYYAFANCTGLTSVTIPNSVPSIGIGLFAGCTGLTSVTIPNSVTSIGDGAFWDCSGLTSVIISKSVTSIGNFAFRGCSSLTKVVCKATTPPTIQDRTFDQYSIAHDITTLYVPANSVYTYKNKIYWRIFSSILPIVPATAIDLDLDNAVMVKGDTLQLTAALQPDDATVTIFDWTSSDESVATVSSEGLVTGVGIGTALITATTVDDSELSATCEVTVNPEPGDTNGDGVRDINDVTDMISYVLGNVVDGFDPDYADLNGDSLIDINDITILIAIILTGA